MAVPVPDCGRRSFYQVFIRGQYRSKGDPVLFLTNPADYRPEECRRELDALKDLNEKQLEATGDPEVATRISQYKLAFRTQTSVPELMSIPGETKETLEMHGVKPGEASLANSCLLARRLVERGVRHIELNDSDGDHHSGLKTRLPAKCKGVNWTAALIRDVKARGLLAETLIVWCSESGRTSPSQGGEGNSEGVPERHHRKDADTMWLSGCRIIKVESHTAEPMISEWLSLRHRFTRTISTSRSCIFGGSTTND